MSDASTRSRGRKARARAGSEVKADVAHVNRTAPRRHAPSLDHQCHWRTAAMKLASCVVATLRTNGKIGVGTGMVMTRVNGQTVIERWDKDFIEALAFIGVEVVDRPRPRSSRAAPRETTTVVRRLGKAR